MSSLLICPCWLFGFEVRSPLPQTAFWQTALAQQSGQWTDAARADEVNNSEVAYRGRKYELTAVFHCFVVEETMYAAAVPFLLLNSGCKKQQQTLGMCARGRAWGIRGTRLPCAGRRWSGRRPAAVSGHHRLPAEGRLVWANGVYLNIFRSYVFSSSWARGRLGGLGSLGTSV